MLICKLVYLFIVFGEHGRYIGNIITFGDELAFQRQGLCVSGLANIINGGSRGLMSNAGLELPYPRFSQAKLREETSRRGK